MDAEDITPVVESTGRNPIGTEKEVRGKITEEVAGAGFLEAAAIAVEAAPAGVGKHHWATLLGGADEVYSKCMNSLTRRHSRQI